MHIEHIRRKYKGKQYVTTLIRESYREGKKVKHRTLANLSCLPKHVIRNLEDLLSDPKVRFENLRELIIERSREYGASHAFLRLAKQLELDRMIYSHAESWREDVLAMIIGRVVYQGSKLHLTHLHKDSALWEICGYTGNDAPDVEKHCYTSLDRLLERQEDIQRELAKRHLKSGCLILYDITSSYLEGEYEYSDLVDFGYSRDGKKGHEQIVIGLLTNEEGCPVATEVFRGNTSDQTTVLGQAERVAFDYGVKKVIFVGDRGMLTAKRIEEVNALGYKTLTALTHAQIRELLERGVLSSEQFDPKHIHEVPDAIDSSIRYFLCKNPDKAKENTETRKQLIAKTTEALTKIALSKKRDEHKKSAQVGKVLAQYKVGKFFQWAIQDGELSFHLDHGKVLSEEAFDGCYAIRTDSDLGKELAVKNYKQLTCVERAFRNLKTVSLEIRPIYHHLDCRIKAHVFLCMLAYYLEWHALQRLQPLFDADGKGENRRWSFARVIERLKSIRIQDGRLNNIQMPAIITTPDSEQQKIMELLQVART